MTDVEHRREARRLERAIRAADKARKSDRLTLAEKLDGIAAVKRLQAQLDAHKLNYYELTRGDA